MKKLLASWVSRLFLDDQNRNRLTCSKDTLWTKHGLTTLCLKPRNRSNEGLRVENLHQKKAKSVPPVGKVMETVFWNYLEIIFVKYLKIGESIINIHNAIILGKFKTGS